ITNKHNTSHTIQQKQTHINDILENLKLTNQTDLKQKDKTKYPLNKIISIAFFAMTTDANNL
ncbi:MAG: hypothetical protein FWB84_08370, partial [Candidatus Bathyarchaeota archaeon]|uniref:hypothetical protein n=1 Tax=Candidatus Bathycorpusculum sp. TaxID=2994959 RepID=UPI0028251414|nr:hypothetical protein [Candidatus Termiticorpusculum sp.]